MTSPRPTPTALDPAHPIRASIRKLEDRVDELERQVAALRRGTGPQVDPRDAQVVTLLTEHPLRMSAITIAENTGISGKNIADVLERLVRQGRVCRTQEPNRKPLFYVEVQP